MTTFMLIELAFGQHCAGKLDEAEALYRQVLQIEPDDLNALQLLGALVLDRGLFEEAINLLERAAEHLQTSHGEVAQHATLYYNLGNALKAANRGFDAIVAYRTAIALAPAMPEGHGALAVELAAQGDLEGAANSFAAALVMAGDRADWLHYLATTLVGLGRDEEALAPLARLVEIEPGNSTYRRDIGKALFATHRPVPARESLLRAIALRPNDAEAWCTLGHIARLSGQLDEAEAAYRRALVSDGDNADTLFNLGLLAKDGRKSPAEAIALFDRVLAVMPRHVEVHAAIGNAWRDLKGADRAIESFRRYVALSPNSAAAHFHLGRALAEAGRSGDAVPFLQQAVRLDSTHALSHLTQILLGCALQQIGQIEEAWTEFRLALAQNPVVTLRSNGAEAMSVLFFLAPGLTNTPYETLVHGAPYDANFLLLIPDTDYDIDALRLCGDIVVNLVSDADQDRAILPVAILLIDQLGKPVINHPAAIMRTDRESMAALLSNIPNCRTADIQRHAGAKLLSPESRQELQLPAFPILARRSGGHNGDDFERLETPAQLERFVSRDAGADYYVIPYLDYRSSDGFFRKYRFFFVSGAIFPYHLAIGPNWKLHHVNTDMAGQSWMKLEEEAFLRTPAEVFKPAQMATLRAIADAVGLAFFGIDCALDATGNVVVFEANATMLIHEGDNDFPYRDPYISAIKGAFTGLIAANASKRVCIGGSPGLPYAAD